MEKTNAMRILDRNKIIYKTYSYVGSGAVSGVEVAKALNQNPDLVFKTLVTVAKSKQHYVFMIPVEKELDLKKAAESVNEKALDMLKSKELFGLTGYVHGGCSPLGMKKTFTTVIDKSAESIQTVIFSAGKIGYQIETTISELKKVLEFTVEDIIL